MKDKIIKTTMYAGAVFIVVSLIAILIVLRIPQRGVNKLKSLNKFNVSVYEEKIDIEGLEKPFEIYFVADSHISLCDDRDKELAEKCSERYQAFMFDSRGADENFSTIIKYIRKDDPDLVIFGGDIADEATYASIEFIEKEIGKLRCPYLFCMGNHDFEYGNEYFSEKAYDEYLTRFDSINEVRESVEIRHFDEFDILLLDDANNRFGAETVSAIEELKRSGKPVIIAEHVPLVPDDPDSDLIERTNEVWGGNEDGSSRVLLGTGGIYPDEPTSQLIGFVKEEDSPVRLVLAGHIHFFHRDMINDNAVQLTTDPAYERGIIKIILY